jgi:hypothetical protein
MFLEMRDSRKPVLSEHKIDTEASSSIAVNLLTITCFFASVEAPTAIVIDMTVGKAI